MYMHFLREIARFVLKVKTASWLKLRYIVAVSFTFSNLCRIIWQVIGGPILVILIAQRQ